MIREAIIKLANKEDIGFEMAEAVMNEIMSGEASEVQKSAYLTALSMKGETIDEITASAKEMRRHCVRFLNDQDVLEIVGTGGDRSNSFNISTTSSIIRAASSRSGAADCFEALGVNIQVDPEKGAEILRKIGIIFLFAQNYHISMKYVGPVRKELGIRTVFNILGPLANPAGANMELMGVYDESLCVPLAQVLFNLGVNKALVVYGQDGLDEISMSSPTTICEVRNGWVRNYEIKPEDFGFERCSKEELVGGSAEENAKITMNILTGKEQGPKRNVVLMNAGAAIYLAGKAESIADGVKVAAEILDSGKALEKLQEYIELSNA